MRARGGHNLEPQPRLALELALRRPQAPRLKTVVDETAGGFPGPAGQRRGLVSTITWFWQNGPFAQAQVMATVQTYLVGLRVEHAKAERLRAR